MPSYQVASFEELPPIGPGSSAAVTTSSTAALATGAPAGGIGVGQQFIMFIYIPTAAPAAPVDVPHIRFGDANVPNATLTDIPLPVGVYKKWLCGPNSSHFKMIATATSAGTIYWFPAAG